MKFPAFLLLLKSKWPPGFCEVPGIRAFWSRNPASYRKLIYREAIARMRDLRISFLHFAAYTKITSAMGQVCGLFEARQRTFCFSLLPSRSYPKIGVCPLISFCDFCQVPRYTALSKAGKIAVATCVSPMQEFAACLFTTIRAMWPCSSFRSR